MIDHLPWFCLYDPWVTREFEIVDLLCHRSGLPTNAGISQVFLGYSQDDMFQHLRFFRPISSFRSQYAYQNIFFLIAARIAEKNNNLNFYHLIKQKILNPLEMENTTATLEDYLKSSNRAEWIRHLKDGQNLTLPEDYPYRNWNYLIAPAGGINSNLKDMLKWISLHANQGVFKGQQIISKEWKIN